MIKLLVICVVAFLSGYFCRKILEIINRPIKVTRIVGSIIEGGVLSGCYTIEDLDGNIQYIRPPVTLTLEK